MKNINCCQAVRLVFCLATFLPAGVSMAALDKFEPYAFTRVLYDSNIFRVSDDSVRRDEEDDTITHLGGGVEADLKLSRQHLLLDLEVDRALYRDFDDLDHTRVDGRGTWAWRVGNLWTGNLGYGYKKKLSSFDEQFVRVKDMRTTHTGFLDAGYQIHPDWRLSAGVVYNDISYEERNRLDRDTTGGVFSVQYKNTLNSRIGVRVKYTDNDLREQETLGIRVNNDYTETEISGLFYWEGTAKSALEANFGYTEQSFDQRDDRDYKGGTGRLTYFWKATGKTKVDFSIWRETSTKFNEVATYVLAKGASVRPTWSVTSKVTIFGDVSYVEEDFKAQNEIVSTLGGQRRNDDTWRARIGTRWRPRQYLQLSLSYSRQDRDSSIDVRDYDVDQVDARAQFNF